MVAAILGTILACKGGTHVEDQPSMTSTTSSGATGGSSTTSLQSTGGENGSDNFLRPPDMGGPGPECDPWQDACPDGQKCKPYGDWDGAHCVEVVPSAGGAGEPCESPEWSLGDECDRGTMCFDYGQGSDLRCLSLCQGSSEAWACPDECSNCSDFGNGLFGVCSLTCDPRAPACPNAQACIGIPSLPRFLCLPVGGEPPKVKPGQPCPAGQAACQEGAVCVSASLVPGCAAESCCASVCDLKGQDSCIDSLAGTACSPWPFEGPEFEAQCLPPDLGLCIGA